jgi:hypothetical protein
MSSRDTILRFQDTLLRFLWQDVIETVAARDDWIEWTYLMKVEDELSKKNG